MSRPIGILAAVRIEGYQEGIAQMGQVIDDDAYERGLMDAEREAPSRFRWFLAGMIAGLTPLVLWGLT